MPKNQQTIIPQSTGVLPTIYPKNGKVTRYRKTPQLQNDFLTAYVKNMGLIHKSCSVTAIRYSIFKRWKTDHRFMEKMNQAQEQVNELVEKSLINKFATHSPVPEIFYLRSRDPRYSQRVSIEGNQDAPIVVTHSRETLEAINKTIMEVLSRE